MAQKTEAPARKTPHDPGAEAWRLFFELFTRNKPRLAAIGSELDLAPMQMHALRLLDPQGQVPMNALAENMACDPSNVTGIVDRLEARGLIERRGAEHDRRVKMLALTEEGARVRGHIMSRMAVPPPEIAGLSRADQRALRDLLRKALGP
jgi:MarR family transcriptional regulator, organic hydroperoxide resistance regulator